MPKSPYFGFRERPAPINRSTTAADAASSRPTVPDLVALARMDMLERGFIVDFPKDAIWQTNKLAAPDFDKSAVRDLTGLYWSSIDNDDSLDLDQIAAAREEAGGIRLLVAIADVDHFVPRGSPLDVAAQRNTTSIYTGVVTFPMLPEKLSTGLSSLNEGEKRFAIVADMLVGDGAAVSGSSLYRAIVQNKAKLTYNATSLWLEGKQERDAGNGISEAGARTLKKIGQSAELQAQLRLMDRAAQLLRERRDEAGALNLRTSDLQPVVSSEGGLESLREREQTRAGLLIEDLMIAANIATATFLDEKGFPSMRRVVKIPARWDRIMALAESLGTILPETPDSRSLEAFLKAREREDPETFPDLSLAIVKLLGRGEYVPKKPGESAPGHFGLAARHYSHSTAPNRRYPDLITQRLVKAALAGERPPYSFEQLERLGILCTQKEDLSNKVERFVKKCAAATILMDHIGETFDAVIAGVSTDGTWVRLSHPPVEGKLVGSLADLDVGHRLRVRLLSVRPERGFVDFEPAPAG